MFSFLQRCRSERFLMDLRQSLHHLYPHSFDEQIINLRSLYSGRLILILSLHLIICLRTTQRERYEQSTYFGHSKTTECESVCNSSRRSSSPGDRSRLRRMSSDISGTLSQANHRFRQGQNSRHLTPRERSIRQSGHTTG